MDDDVAGMTPDERAAEVVRLRAGIRAHRDSKGHNLCWWVPELWALLPDSERTDPRPPAWPEFIQKCAAYRSSLDVYYPAMSDKGDGRETAVQQHKAKFASLNDMAASLWGTSESKGFHDEPVPMAVSCSNLHGEVSELWEAHRNGLLDKPCDKAEKMAEAGLPALTCVEEELADVVIRALDTARENGVDIGSAVAVKDLFNQTRPFKHGGKRA